MFAVSCILNILLIITSILGIPERRNVSLVRFEVLTVMFLRTHVFLDVTPFTG